MQQRPGLSPGQLGPLTAAGAMRGGTQEHTPQNPLVLHSQRNKKRASPGEAEKENNTSPTHHLKSSLGKACCLQGNWSGFVFLALSEVMAYLLLKGT